MKILLIHPQAYSHRLETGMYSWFLRYAPITMPTLAALVPASLRATIRVIDELVEVVDFNWKPDIVGITAITGTATRAYEIADLFRRKGIPVIIGGVHATLLPDEAAQHADAVVCGYAEKTWPSLLIDFSKGCMKPRYIDSPIEPPDIKPPCRTFIHRHRYLMPYTIEIIRGCNNHCDFCISANTTRFLIKKDIGSVIKEIKNIPGKMVTFLDPNLIVDPLYAKELMTELKLCRKWWMGCVTVEIFQHLELLENMIESGCKGLLIGFDSINIASLIGARKTFNQVGQYRDIIRLLHKKGIMIEGCFVFGFDEDDSSIFNNTVEFAIDSKIDLVQYTAYTPFPGTPAFEKREKEGRILTRDWALYNGQHVVFHPHKMDTDVLEKGLRYAWRKTYQYSAIFKRLSSSPSLLTMPSLLSNFFLRRFMSKLHSNLI